MRDDPARPHTIAGLVDKRAELAALLKFHRAEIRKIVCDMDHLDASIRIFDPEADISRVKRYPTAHRAAKGQMRRFVLTQFRVTTAPLTSAQIAEAWMKDRRLKADESTYVVIRKRVGSCLNALKHAGVIEPKAEMVGEFKAWAPA
jgi:hypothetical protein